MSKAPVYRLSPTDRPVFLGLLLGMFVASVSQMIVGPAMPIIVSDLGGMEYFSWVATTAMLASAVTVPLVGKLSDLYGRRKFYLGGLIVFMIGAIVCGSAVSFWMIIVGRAIQGIGMGTLMPLSQTIIGDIVPPRFRGKYQGYMGAVFGVSSVAGPLVGGLITDLIGWRWLFFIALPLVIIAFLVIRQSMKIEHTPREAHLDIAGVVTMAPSLVAILLATSWGGNTYPWLSLPVLGLYLLGGVGLALFLFLELRAKEPLLPLGIFRNRTLVFANFAAFSISMVMFGAITYIPVFAQGVLGYSAGQSGMILMPLMVLNVTFGLVAGFAISRTGRYKGLMILGIILVGAAMVLLMQVSVDTKWWQLIVALMLMGIGLGLAVQQYMLVVQNASSQRNLGIVTSTTQFFRNVGSTVGITVFGAVINNGLLHAVLAHLPDEVRDSAEQQLQGLDAGALINQTEGAQYSPEILRALEFGLAQQLSASFFFAVPLVAIALVATLAIPNLPLRETLASADEKPVVSALGDEVTPNLTQGDGARTRERLLALRLRQIESQSHNDENALLQRAIRELGGGNLDAGRGLLLQTATMLASDDSEVILATEKYAAALGRAGGRPGGVLSPEVRQQMAIRAAQKDRHTVLGSFEPAVTASFEAINLDSLTSAANDLSTVLVLDLTVPAKRDESAPS